MVLLHRACREQNVFMLLYLAAHKGNLLNLIRNWLQTDCNLTEELVFKVTVPCGGAQGCEVQFLRIFWLQGGQLLQQLQHAERVLLLYSALGLHGA
jgi:hypothetical protein